MGRIRTESAVPMYRQLAEILRARISTGEVSSGDRIPSEAQLSEDFSISRITVRQALAQLENDGLLQRVPGKGTFVRANTVRVERLTRLSGFGENMSALGLTVGYRTLYAAESMVDAEAAEHLQSADGRAYVIRRVLLTDGKPVGMHVSHLPVWLATRDRGGRLFIREALDKRSLYETIEECGVRIHRGEETVEPGLADKDEAETLQMPEGNLLLRVKRITYDSDDQPVEYVLLTYRADSFTFRLRLYRDSGP